ncbi:translocase of chloroplast 34 [Physcomitrium patens]|nr:uncharacterized protein LOC112278394 [Physcomitrium patens]XP_024367578.1 uncharacterized protein LOC112278394 [Physcomitrium patens]|eukprot:XP_024367577.1 uncharacterized protein LOC112278394 [Physcomitrella patens]
MAATQAREWTGLLQFPVATQTALHNILGKLRQQKKESLTVLVVGKGGVGKSSTVNSIIGERVTVVSAFQSETLRPLQCARTRAGFTLNVIDTPGLIEGGCINDQALDIIKRFLLNKTIDVVLYVDRLDGYRVDNLDKQVIRALARSFGPNFWRIAIIALTHAQLSPPDGVDYTEFVNNRSAALRAAIRQEAGFKKSEGEISYMLVENSGRCNTNSEGEKVLPNGSVWLPALVDRIAEVATGATPSIHVDQKLIDGPNANGKGKWWIPLIILAQYFLIVRPIRSAIEKDLIEEEKQRPQWQIRAEEFVRPTASLYEDDQVDEQAIRQALKQGALNDQMDSFVEDDEDDDEY